MKNETLQIGNHQSRFLSFEEARIIPYFPEENFIRDLDGPRLRAILLSVLRTLSDKQRRSVELRFGLDCEIGRKRARGRFSQRELRTVLNSAMRKLRHPKRIYPLLPLLGIRSLELRK